MNDESVTEVQQVEAIRLLALVVEAFGGPAGAGEASTRFASVLPQLKAADDQTLAVVLAAADVAKESVMHILRKRMSA